MIGAASLLRERTVILCARNLSEHLTRLPVLRWIRVAFYPVNDHSISIACHSCVNEHRE